MAGIAVARSAFINIVDMTFRAARISMNTSQCKAGRIVIERSRFPRGGGVAGTANISEGALVGILGSMACITVGGDALPDLIDMTICAGHRRVLTCQFKYRQVVIEGCRCPPLCRMAGSAICAKAALVRIFWSMAGIAVSGGSLENLVFMTLCAGDVSMETVQFEDGQIVIKGCWSPTFSGMAGATIASKAILVNIFPWMTGCTGLGSSFQVGNIPGIDMAFWTLYKHMFLS
jgi:hypothetical protein